MERRFGEVLEDEDHIELLETELHTLQRRDLDVRKCNDEEWGVREVDKALCCRLQPYVGTERHTLER